ncbi:MAG: DUF2125 domain-containing protein [Rhodospirillales bacterium]|nr:DUF2125 domain-containing protein [Rhodospirillales bacterium]MDE2318983.1 DUF2125 domain-containing protein [Rhodospirillales bacterium]
MRGFIKGLAGLIVLIVLAWLGVWLYAEMRLKQLVAAEINRANASGTVQISYDKLTTSSSPLVASVALANPSWTSRPDASAPAITLRAAKIGMHVDIFAPLLLHVDMPQSIAITTPEASGALTFAVADVTEKLSPSLWTGNIDNPITGGDARFAGINLLASNGSLQVAQIDSLVLHESLNAKANPGQTAMAVSETMNHFQLSPIIARLINLPFNGQIAYLALSMRLSGPLNWQSIAKQVAALPPGDARVHFMLQSLHQWALAGGSGQGKLTAILGPSRVDANGSLLFDKQAQPSGTWDLTANHLDQFTTALTSAYPALQNNVNQFEARLSPYLSTTQAGGQVLAVNTAYGKNGVTINGTKTGDMPPLDWNNLLNPPPPPPVAPGDGSGAASP